MNWIKKRGVGIIFLDATVVGSICQKGCFRYGCYSGGGIVISIVWGGVIDTPSGMGFPVLSKPITASFRWGMGDLHERMYCG